MYHLAEHHGTRLGMAPSPDANETRDIFKERLASQGINLLMTEAATQDAPITQTGA